MQQTRVLAPTVVPRRSLESDVDQLMPSVEAGAIEAWYEAWTRATNLGPSLASRFAMPFADLWTALAETSLRYSATLRSPSGWVLAFRRGRSDARHYTLSAREQQVLRRTLIGQGQKRIALDLCITESTVGHSARSAMMKIGFRSRLEATPFAALATWHEHGRGGLGEPTIFKARGGELVFARVPEPEWQRFPQLTQSERAICDLIIAGKSNHEIAEARATALGTAQNQVASAFRKLGVNGRLDLLRALLATDEVLPPTERAQPVHGLPSSRLHGAD